MRKILNDPEQYVEESLEGFAAAYSRYYEKPEGVKGILLKNRRKEKVAVVVGGGSGHEPMFSGFVGKGLADAAACGNLFASPDPGTVYAVGAAADSGKGILFIYGNYAGDNLNFDMAEEMLQDDGYKTAHIRVCDDVASAPAERAFDRRGIAGDVFMIKIAGAACDEGLSLEEAVRVCEKTMNNMRSIGVATAPGQLPGVAAAMFELPEGKIEYGMGLHGEEGVKRTDMEPADQLAETIYKDIVSDMPVEKGDEVCVLVNGLGSTTIGELSIIYRKVARMLAEDGVRVHDADVNSFCTSQEMGGFSVTLLKLDEELRRYYDMPCFCPFYAKQSGGGI